MKPCFNISNFLDGYNALLTGWTLLLTGIFGAYWYLFAALLLFNVLDWLSGWYKARRLHEESSKVGLAGVVKKLCYWILIAVAFTTAAVFEAVGADVLHIDLSCLHLLGWFTLANLTVNEARSIVENLVAIGVAVPSVLTEGLQITATLLENSATKNTKLKKTATNDEKERTL